jgi:aspartate-semialdehyde dehydrogenase
VKWTRRNCGSVCHPPSTSTADLELICGRFSSRFARDELLPFRCRFRFHACFAQGDRQVTIDMLMGNYHIVVVGATGAAGTELLRVLERRNFPVGSLCAIGSDRSVGKSIGFRGESIPVEKLSDRSFEKTDIAFFCAGGDISRKYVPIACQADAIAIDKSSAFRMDPQVPLVIPEINAEDVRRHRGIIANPNCTTTVMLMALYPLHRIFHVRRVFAASYQAVSGSGTRGVEELARQTKEAVAEPMLSFGPRSATSATDASAGTVYPHPIAFNLLPHIDSFLESGYTKEEAKMQDEARKIMHSPALRVSATCVRVPVYRAHSVAVSAEFQQPLSVEQAREILSKAPGLELVDEPNNNRYPMPLSVAGKDNCQVGRVRLDCGFENGLSFWVSGDQLLKGAALNAVQIAELL